MVALVCPWHEHHRQTVAALDARLDSGAKLLLAAPALVEAYAVLTRLPAPYRLPAASARDVLRANFAKLRTVSLAAGDYWRLLDRAPGEGVLGGRTYDAIIAACARKGKAGVLLTLNLGHFEQFAGEGLRVVSPAEAR